MIKSTPELSKEVCEAIAVVLKEGYNLTNEEVQFVHSFNFKMCLPVDITHLGIPWFSGYPPINLAGEENTFTLFSNEKFFVYGIDFKKNLFTHIQINPMISDAVQNICSFDMADALWELIGVVQACGQFRKSLLSQWTEGLPNNLDNHLKESITSTKNLVVKKNE